MKTYHFRFYYFDKACLIILWRVLYSALLDESCCGTLIHASTNYFSDDLGH